MSVKLTDFDERIGKYRNEVANISRLRQKMEDIVDENLEFKQQLLELKHTGDAIREKVAHFTMV